MTLCPARFGWFRLSTLVASVLALLVVTFGSASFDVYRPIAPPTSTWTEVPTEELTQHGSSALKAAALSRAERPRERSPLVRTVAPAALQQTRPRVVLRPVVALRVVGTDFAGAAPRPLRC
jgi:hypothetical protein